MSDTSKCCPKCGSPISPEAPQGLCPKCLLQQASYPTEAGQGATKPAPPTREELAAAFPQLEILELIGQGGMGFVFKARQPKLDRLVALKILPQSLAADPAFAERFTREGRMLARPNHPNIVTIHDFGQANGYFYLLMEFVDGVNLRQAMRVGRFTADQALAVVPKICEALQFAHTEGILHRDIKPENILLDSKGRVKIADFGIAKLMGESSAQVTLTGSGAALGTPHYMAPEQIEKPGQVDHRADIYSLGVVFYEMLTGELPLGRFAPPSQKSTVDPRMDDVVLRTLAKEREHRQQSADDVKTQVENITGTGPKSAGTPPPIAHLPLINNGRLPKLTLLAALLSSISLFLFLFISLGAHHRPEVAFVLLCIFGIPALIGTVIGFMTLADQRHSPNPPRCLKRTLIAATAWPVMMIDALFSFAFIGFFFSLFRQYHSGALAFITILFCAILLIALDAAFIRGVIRWVKREPLWVPPTRRRLATWTIFWGVPFLLLLLLVVASHGPERIRDEDFSAQVAPQVPINPPPPPAPPAAASVHEGLGLSSLGVSSGSGSSAQDIADPEAKFVIDSAVSVSHMPTPGEHFWGFKGFVPPNHLASILFIRWTNGVPAIDSGFSTYFKVGNAGGVDIAFCSLSCYHLGTSNYLSMDDTNRHRYFAAWNYPESAGISNAVRWDVNLGAGFTASSVLPTPPYEPLNLEVPQSVTVGHQRVLRFINFDNPEDQSHPSGVELRLLLEPLKSPAVRMVPNEYDMKAYIAGRGLASSMEETLNKINEWPTDP